MAAAEHGEVNWGCWCSITSLECHYDLQKMCLSCAELKRILPYEEFTNGLLHHVSRVQDKSK